MISWLKWLKKDREQIVTNLESLTNNREDGQKRGEGGMKIAIQPVVVQRRSLRNQEEKGKMLERAEAIKDKHNTITSMFFSSSLVNNTRDADFRKITAASEINLEKDGSQSKNSVETLKAYELAQLALNEMKQMLEEDKKKKAEKDILEERHAQMVEGDTADSCGGERLEVLTGFNLLL